MTMTSSEQARADAMADAETLQVIAVNLARQEARPWDMQFGGDYPVNTVAWDIQDAEVKLCPSFYGVEYQQETNAQRATWAARAAFRACPGLRGDR